MPMNEVLARAVELREQGLSYSAIAQVLSDEMGYGVSKDSVQKLVARHADLQAPIRRVVVVGDIHAKPDPKLTELVIAEDPDIIIVAGDLLDAASLNSHGSHVPDQKAEFRAEIAACRGYLSQLSTSTRADILVMRGNHETRLHRILEEILPEDVIEVLGDPLEIVIRDIDRVSLSEMPLTHHHPNGDLKELGRSAFMLRLGDCLISHNNWTGKNPGMAVRKLYEWTLKWWRVLGWPTISLYIQLHGHKMADLDEEGGFVRLVEPGMGGTADAVSYQLVYNTKWSPSSIGAVSFVQEHKGSSWTTQLNTVRILRK